MMIVNDYSGDTSASFSTNTEQEETLFAVELFCEWGGSRGVEWLSTYDRRFNAALTQNLNDVVHTKNQIQKATLNYK